MNPEWKQKWVEALRSGEYKQGKQKLRSASDEFCCLGILCDIYDPNNWIKPDKLGYVYLYKGERGHDVFDMPPNNIKTHLGLDDETILTLVRLNDGYVNGSDDRVDGVSFMEIAEYIEENL